MINFDNEELYEAKLRFNDMFLREAKLGTTEEDGYVYDYNTNDILTIKGKPIKYCEYELPRANEIDLNLIENPRLASTLAVPYINNRCAMFGYQFYGVSHSISNGSKKGYYTVTYKDANSNELKSFSSSLYVNESIRIFDVICRLNDTIHLYTNELAKMDLLDFRKK